LLAAVLIATCIPVGAAQNEAVTATSLDAAEQVPVHISLHGEPMAVEQPAFLSEGVTLVPLRSIAEALGAVITYTEEGHRITLRKDSTLINLAIGSLSAQKNGQLITLEVAPRLVGNV